MKKSCGNIKKKKKKTLFSLWRDLFGSIFIVAIIFTTIMNVTYYNYERDYVLNEFEWWNIDFTRYWKDSGWLSLATVEMMQNYQQDLEPENLETMESHEIALYRNLQSIKEGGPFSSMYAILKDENGNVIVHTKPENINKEIFAWDETYMRELLEEKAPEDELECYTLSPGESSSTYYNDYDRGLVGFEGRYRYTFKIEDTPYTLLVAMKVDDDSYIMTTMIRNTILGVFFSIVFSFILAFYFYRIYKKEIKLQKQQRDFSNALAHDLKTPLMAISGYAENLAENICPEKSGHYIEEIKSNVAYMDRLVGQILDLAKTEQGAVDLKIETLELSSMIEKVLAQYEILVEEKKLAVTIEGDAKIQADGVKMERVLENLLRNAITYSPEGNKVSVKMDKEHLEIRNTGVEISEEDLQDIWKPFVTGEKSRKRESGHGLGLSIVANILDLHGFRYEIKSEKQTVCVCVFF